MQRCSITGTDLTVLRSALATTSGSRVLEGGMLIPIVPMIRPPIRPFTMCLGPSCEHERSGGNTTVAVRSFLMLMRAGMKPEIV